jgi:ATP-dependent Clp protease adaptor protein ClpS
MGTAVSQFLRNEAAKSAAEPYIITRNGLKSGVSEPDSALMSDRRDQSEHHTNVDLAVEEARPRLEKPRLHRVVLLNDDFTPMEFVVEILEGIFSMQRTRATQVMLEVHTKGKGICGVYSFEIAETKVAQVLNTAKQQQHPLLCTMEET